jgi:predicted  nucleic acid-binding Zn-ribbon protein
MPHQCVKCSALYPDDTTVIVTGCTCGAVTFFYVREKIEQHEVADEVRACLLAQNKPVILDLESINRTSEGKFDIDLHALFGKSDLIYKDEEGKYTVDLEESFRRHNLGKKEE